MLACKRARRSEKLFALLVFSLLIGVIIAINIAWAVYSYGDWTCAFSECRKLKS
jgi:hypothetical protein